MRLRYPEWVAHMVINVAVVGAGSFAQQHLDTYSRMTTAQVSWVCDVNADAAAQAASRFGVANTSQSFDEILEDPDVELVDLVTSVHLHASQAIQALEAGKSVLCEKPMAINLAESLRMVEAANRAPGRLFVKYHQRFDPVHERLRDLLVEQAYGRGLVAHFTLLGNHLEALQSTTHWRGDPKYAGGGCLFESGSHLVDLMHFWFGAAKRVTATTHQRAAQNPDKGEDTATMVVEFADGMVLTFVGFWASNSWEWRKRIFTSDQSELRVETSSSNLLIHATRNGDRILAEQDDWFRSSIDASINHYVHSCASGAPARFGLADFLQPMRTLDAAYRSAEEGRTIELD